MECPGEELKDFFALRDAAGLCFHEEGRNSESQALGDDLCVAPEQASGRSGEKNKQNL